MTKDKCSFCGKAEKLVLELVPGPETAICNECVTWFYEEVLQPEHRVGARPRIGGIRGDITDPGATGQKPQFDH